MADVGAAGSMSPNAMKALLKNTFLHVCADPKTVGVDGDVQEEGDYDDGDQARHRTRRGNRRGRGAGGKGKGKGDEGFDAAPGPSSSKGGNMWTGFDQAYVQAQSMGSHDMGGFGGYAGFPGAGPNPWRSPWGPTPGMPPFGFDGGQGGYGPPMMWRPPAGPWGPQGGDDGSIAAQLGFPGAAIQPPAMRDGGKDKGKGAARKQQGQVRPGPNTTTMMLRNIPNKYTQPMLLSELNTQGFWGTYDFFYLPIDFQNRCNVGYAFVNFKTADDAMRFKKKFDQQQLPAYSSSKVCEVSCARVQGLRNNIEHYRNSPVFGIPVPQYWPLLFKDGVEVPFPPPDAPLPPIQLRVPKC